MDPPNPNCDGCAMRSIPVNTEKHFGHTKCTFHRECTGRAYWEPDACAICLGNDRLWGTVDPSIRYAKMEAYAAMLETCKKKINHAYPNRNWDYVPIMNFKFGRHQFNKVEKPQQDSNAQQTVHTQSPLLDNKSDSQEYNDDDFLIIEPGQDSFYESESDSSDDDLQSSVAQVNSCNQILKDVCTELYCINNNLSAM